MVFRVGDAWLAGVGKLPPPMGSDVLLVSPHGSLARLKACTSVLYVERKKTDTARQGRLGQGSETRGALLVASSSPTLSPIYDGLDVSVTLNITWFHLNQDMVSRRIYKLSFYG